jgi:predicted transcriptional regulator
MITKRVNEDVKRLALLGFIGFEKERAGEKTGRKAPRPRYDSVLVEIPLT